MAAVRVWPNPLTLVLGVMIVGARQLGLAILMHDAAHGLLFRRRRVNDWVGRWLCGAPVVASMDLYRPYHLTHHRRRSSPTIPTSVSRRRFRSRARASVARWCAISRADARISGAGCSSATRSGRRRGRGAAGSAAPPSRIGRGLLVNVVLLGALTALGYWYLYVVLWLLPPATWYQLISRIRNIAEHAVVPDNDDPLRNTRTTHAGWLERAFIAPYFVNYHLEHHLFLFVPCWRLRETHRVLVREGAGAAHGDPARLSRDAAPGDERRARQTPRATPRGHAAAHLGREADDDVTFAIARLCWGSCCSHCSPARRSPPIP